MAEGRSQDASLGPRTLEGAIFIFAQVQYYIELSGWNDQEAVAYLRGLRAEAHMAMRSPLAQPIKGKYQTGASYLFGEMHELQSKGASPDDSLLGAATRVADELGIDEATVLFYYHTRGDIVMQGDRRMTREEFDRDSI